MNQAPSRFFLHSSTVKTVAMHPFVVFLWQALRRTILRSFTKSHTDGKSNSHWGCESSVITWWRPGCNLKVFVGDVFRIKPVKFEPFWTNTHKQTAVPGSTLCDTEQNTKNLLAIREMPETCFSYFYFSFVIIFWKKTGINTNVRARRRLI